MIRFVLRFIGLLLLALGFIFLVYDGIRSISDGHILLTRTSEVWLIVHDKSLTAFQAMVEKRAGVDIWQAVVSPVLEQPASATSASAAQSVGATRSRRRRIRGDIETMPLSAAWPGDGRRSAPAGWCAVRRFRPADRRNARSGSPAG